MDARVVSFACYLAVFDQPVEMSDGFAGRQHQFPAAYLAAKQRRENIDCPLWFRAHCHYLAKVCQVLVFQRLQTRVHAAERTTVGRQNQYVMG